MLDKDRADQFATMLMAGLPAADAVGYFYPDLDRREVVTLALQWSRDALVQQAILRLQGKAWQEMSTDEMLRYAVEKNYKEMAFFLYSRNYSELTGAERAKADTCREALEAKLAGNAGKLSALEQFYEDLAKGKVKLGASSVPAVAARPN